LGLRIPRPAKQKQRLTPREAEVHELLAQGLTNEQIAKLLFISLSTTKVHVKHIYDKLGVRSRLEAARALRSDV
jgi:two-component system nitrate/nitrite response regulator NarL